MKRRPCPDRPGVRRRSSTGVRSAPPPNQALRGHDEARVHVHRRHMRIVQMRDQRDARGPEARVLDRRRGCPCGTRARTRRARSRQCTPTFSNTRPRIIDHHAAAARRAGVIGARPGLALEPARRPVGMRHRLGQRVLQRLEGAADVVAQALEPGAGAVLAGFERVGVGKGRGHGVVLASALPVHEGLVPVCRIASPSAMAAAIATLIERSAGRIGISSRASAACVHRFRHAGDSRAEQEDVGWAEAMVEIAALRRGREKNEPQPKVTAPCLERRPRRVALEHHLVQIIHAGAAEVPVRHREAGRLDDDAPPRRGRRRAAESCPRSAGCRAGKARSA